MFKTKRKGTVSLDGLVVIFTRDNSKMTRDMARVKCHGQMVACMKVIGREVYSMEWARWYSKTAK
jgi:hypothetical protein